MIKLSLVISLTLFLTGLLQGTAKPEMAVEDTGFEEVEITGLFSVGGKPMVSLSIRNSSSGMVKIGQRSRGIKLLQVQGDDDPHVCAGKERPARSRILEQIGTITTREVRTGGSKNAWWIILCQGG